MYEHAFEATVDRHPALTRTWLGFNYPRTHQFMFDETTDYCFDFLKEDGKTIMEIFTTLTLSEAEEKAKEYAEKHSIKKWWYIGAVCGH